MYRVLLLDKCTPRLPGHPIPSSLSNRILVIEHIQYGGAKRLRPLPLLVEFKLSISMTLAKFLDEGQHSQQKAKGIILLLDSPEEQNSHTG
jgi:hypothetical protein